MYDDNNQNNEMSSFRSGDDVYVSGAEYGAEYLELIRNEKGFESSGVAVEEDQSFLEKLAEFIPFFSRIKTQEKAGFYHMLHLMIDAGIPLIKALETVRLRIETPRFQRVVNTMVKATQKGTTLADAMSRFSNVFDESEIGIIRSGESTGRLNFMLERLSVQLEKRARLESKLWSAAVYPMFVLGVLTVVMAVMFAFILPKLLSAFEEGGFSENLPAITQSLVTLQSFVSGNWLAILMAVLVIYAGFKIYVTSNVGAVKWDMYKLRFPFVGNLLRKVYVLRFVDLLGILIDSGLPVVSALHTTANSIDNKVYKLKIKEIIRDVKSGQKISYSMGDMYFLFPPEVSRMLEVGESTASVGQVSTKISDQYDKEVDASLKSLMAVFEPALIVFVALIVAYIAFAMMMPILDLSSSLSV